MFFVNYKSMPLIANDLGVNAYTLEPCEYQNDCRTYKSVATRVAFVP